MPWSDFTFFKLDNSISDTDFSSREFRTRLCQPELAN